MSDVVNINIIEEPIEISIGVIYPQGEQGIQGPQGEPGIISPDSVGVNELKPELKASLNIPSNIVDWSLGIQFSKTLTEDVDFSMINQIVGKTIWLRVAGDFSISIENVDNDLLSGYDGNNYKIIEIYCSDVNDGYYSYIIRTSIEPPIIPDYSSIIRRLYKRENNILKASVGPDAQLLLPVSEFDGIDGSASFMGEDTNYFEFEGYIKTNTYLGIQTIFNSNNGSNGIDIRIQNGRVEVMRAGVSVIISSIAVPFLSIGTTVKVKVVCDKDLNLSQIYFNDVLDNSSTCSEVLEFTTFALGREALTRYLNGSLRDVKITLDNNSYSIPLPHLAYGFDQNGDAVPLTVTGGVTEGFDIEGSRALLNDGFSIKDGNIVPHNSDGLAIIQDYDTDYAGTSFINPSPFKVRLFTTGDTDPEYTFFDKSNALIWKQSVRDSIYYDTGDTGLFDSTEMLQAWIYTRTEDAYKYQWWSKDYKDLFLYSAALTEPALSNAIKYVGVSE